jgi:hypothetical protein
MSTAPKGQDPNQQLPSTPEWAFWLAGLLAVAIVAGIRLLIQDWPLWLLLPAGVVVALLGGVLMLVLLSVARRWTVRSVYPRPELPTVGEDVLGILRTAMRILRDRWAERFGRATDEPPDVR